jgi:4-oxalocrotonate tautomerase|tara:strand:- start:13311 stop:13670 length:360 start_codon:yes stop_codon:yes gene_type:complete
MMNLRDEVPTPSPCRSSSKTVAGLLQLQNWSNACVFRTLAGVRNKENDMPLVDIEVIDGVFDAAQKARMIEKVTDAMVAVEGEAMRGVTWVRVKEVRSGQWGIGGNTPSADDIKAMAKS